MIRLRELGMLRTIDLDDQTSGGRIEISDVATDGLLSVELETEELFTAQASPQPPLGIGRIRAQ